MRVIEARCALFKNIIFGNLAGKWQAAPHLSNSLHPPSQVALSREQLISSGPVLGSLAGKPVRVGKLRGHKSSLHAITMVAPQPTFRSRRPMLTLAEARARC